MKNAPLFLDEGGVFLHVVGYERLEVRYARLDWCYDRHARVYDRLKKFRLIPRTLNRFGFD